ncbi:putative non-classical export protein Nce102 [Viridothelium virens]|uniref:Putative non-classical export protein Nce102 n=1 Tax=Viridothelium virens TaxID=1048519 RepID=A0A6A6GUR8_VIRVR|nr:putative non-classical export protein Nce102 [Viridothelium virens]
MALVNTALRVLQFFWTLLIMALIGNIIATSFAGNPSLINYDMFVAVFSMLSLFYLIPASFRDSFVIHPVLMVALDVLNTIFFFCGAVAMAAELRVHSCGDPNYTLNNKITNGSFDRTKRCREAQASTAFLWFGFASFLVSAVLSALQGRSGGVNVRGVRRPGQPHMSQV